MRYLIVILSALFIAGVNRSDDLWMYYNLSGGLAFHASKKISILAEYRYLNVDYNNGQDGAQFFAFDGAMKGPLLGVGIRF